MPFLPSVGSLEHSPGQVQGQSTEVAVEGTRTTEHGAGAQKSHTSHSNTHTHKHITHNMYIYIHTRHTTHDTWYTTRSLFLSNSSYCFQPAMAQPLGRPSDEFTVRVRGYYLRPTERVRVRPPSAKLVRHWAAAFASPVQTEKDALEMIQAALSLFWYWPSAFAPVQAELRRRIAPAMRARRLQRRRDRYRDDKAVRQNRGNKAVRQNRGKRPPSQ